MKEYKNIVIMKFGKKINETFYPKNTKVKCPKEVPVFFNWNRKKLAGIGRNFRISKNNLIADILLDQDIFDTIVPCLNYEKETKGKETIGADCILLYLGLINDPADKTLKRNLK